MLLGEGLCNGCDLGNLVRVKELETYHDPSSFDLINEQLDGASVLLGRRTTTRRLVP